MSAEKVGGIDGYTDPDQLTIDDALPPEPILLRLPYTSPPLSLNSRDHWRTTHRKKAKLRGEVALLARHAKIGPYPRIGVRLIWQPRDRRQRDGDNPFPTIKSAVDGLVDAGVVPGDDHTRVQHRGVTFLEPEPGQLHGRLWIEVLRL